MELDNRSFAAKHGDGFHKILLRREGISRWRPFLDHLNGDWTLIDYECVTASMLHLALEEDAVAAQCFFEPQFTFSRQYTRFKKAIAGHPLTGGVTCEHCAEKSASRFEQMIRSVQIREREMEKLRRRIDIACDQLRKDGDALMSERRNLEAARRNLGDTGDSVGQRCLDTHQFRTRFGRGHPMLSSLADARAGSLIAWLRAETSGFFALETLPEGPPWARIIRFERKGEAEKMWQDHPMLNRDDGISRPLPIAERDRLIAAHDELLGF